MPLATTTTPVMHGHSGSGGIVWRLWLCGNNGKTTMEEGRGALVAPPAATSRNTERREH
ncbi:hypothetical protein DEO72_LG6g230 [Vigna unguiculata]|uniref:Uncharacterized protein n=2 Tax=Vigna unguiculata TaxID=3917 RepID=A0A4D6M328_VIGUN|nr:hypothetical protein DEO72_LG6g228 [Vigna unguiculata]QCD95536.1 hypothetical protein DEO72_LG6g229 [Vigna unguiculata]QCD95537.1 hypothetical protein DEO72_LG6g230 [Vigna unguiculata]